MSPTSGCVSAFLELFFKVDIKGSGLHFCQRALLMYWAPASGVYEQFPAVSERTHFTGLPSSVPGPCFAWMDHKSQPAASQRSWGCRGGETARNRLKLARSKHGRLKNKDLTLIHSVIGFVKKDPSYFTEYD